MPDKDKKASRHKRASQRFVLLNQQLPGILMTKEEREPVFAKVLDVSKRGLGICLGQQLQNHTQLSLVIQDLEIDLSVVWSERRGESFRHGLKVECPDNDLEVIFFSLGLIDIDLTSATDTLF